MTIYTVYYKVGRGTRVERFTDPADAEHCAKSVGGKVEEEEFENCPQCYGTGEMGGYNAGLLCTLCNGE